MNSVYYYDSIIQSTVTHCMFSIFTSVSILVGNHNSIYQQRSESLGLRILCSLNLQLYAMLLCSHYVVIMLSICAIMLNYANNKSFVLIKQISEICIIYLYLKYNVKFNVYI